MILVVEDEAKIAALLTDYLRHAGFSTYIINHGNEVLPWLNMYQHLQKTAAILLDINLPNTDGFEICKIIRNISNVPILIVSAKSEEQHRLSGLNLGADDYICKPFSPSEVVARVKAVLRRSKKDIETENEIFLDEEKLELHISGRAVVLTLLEMQLLKPLYQSPGRIFSRELLMQLMYQDYRMINDRTIDSHVRKLRKKISSVLPDIELIQSVYGTGYRLVNPFQ